VLLHQAAARVLMRMAHGRLPACNFERTSRRHGTPTGAVLVSAALMFAATSVMALRKRDRLRYVRFVRFALVFGFHFTVVRAGGAALPFARSAPRPASHAVTVASILTASP